MDSKEQLFILVYSGLSPGTPHTQLSSVWSFCDPMGAKILVMSQTGNIEPSYTVIPNVSIKIFNFDFHPDGDQHWKSLD